MSHRAVIVPYTRPEAAQDALTFPWKRPSNVIWLKPPTDPSGCFIPTLNNTGYATTHLDLYSQAFTEYAAQASRSVLEVGAAYGLATLQALAQGATIICNDIDVRHLTIVNREAAKQGLDCDRLTTVQGDFPNEMLCRPEYLSGILMCRVLHLFDGKTIERSLQKAYRWLKPNGKLFIVAETPYLGFLSGFIPQYEERVREGAAWPGLISNVQTYNGEASLPAMINLMDAATLTRSLTAHGFVIEQMDLLDRSDFPPDRRLDGRESIGVIARKQA